MWLAVENQKLFAAMSCREKLLLKAKAGEGRGLSRRKNGGGNISGKQREESEMVIDSEARHTARLYDTLWNLVILVERSEVLPGFRDHGRKQPIVPVEKKWRNL